MRTIALKILAASVCAVTLAASSWRMASAAEVALATLDTVPVAVDQTRSATGNCNGNRIGIEWSGVPTRAGSLKALYNEHVWDLTARLPGQTAFLTGGGAAKVYLGCLDDGQVEVTVFRALRDGDSVNHSWLQFTFDRAGNVTRTLEVRPVEEDLVVTWFD